MKALSCLVALKHRGPRARVKHFRRTVGCLVGQQCFKFARRRIRIRRPWCTARPRKVNTRGYACRAIWTRGHFATVCCHSRNVNGILRKWQRNWLLATVRVAIPAPAMLIINYQCRICIHDFTSNWNSEFRQTDGELTMEFRGRACWLACPSHGERTARPLLKPGAARLVQHPCSGATCRSPSVLCSRFLLLSLPFCNLS